MDYLKQPLSFKIKKVLRYIQLYGFSRTLVKVRGQRHMARTYTQLPALPISPLPGRHVGLLGCGNFAFSNLAYYLKKCFGSVIQGCMDINIHRAASLFEQYRLNYYTDDPKKVIEDKTIDLVYIASNHASHAEYAIQCLEAGKAVHIEKPHAVTHDQLVRLCRTMDKTKGKVQLGFNRPYSPFGLKIFDILRNQPGAAMLSWFIAGHEIDPSHWYFDVKEGGRILGNLCHWTDFTLQMIAPENRYPIRINPTRWEKSDCDIAVNYVFGDGSIGVITFSAKGHTFEGVKERFSAHKGNALLVLEDFQKLIIEIVDKKSIYSAWRRNHGHQQAVEKSYGMVRGDLPGLPVDYVWETGELVLKTREACEKNQPLELHKFRPEFLA